MFVMVAGRQLGKSVTAARWLLEQPGERALLTSTEDRKHHLIRVATRLLPVREMSHRDFADLKHLIMDRVFAASAMSGYVMRGIAVEIGIDDAEEVLRILFQRPVGFAAFNATLVPVVSVPNFNRGDYVDAEQTSIDAPKAILGRPIRDNPQA